MHYRGYRIREIVEKSKVVVTRAHMARRQFSARTECKWSVDEFIMEESVYPPWTSRHDLLCDGFRSFRAVRANNSARFSSAIAGDVTRHTKVESDEVDPRHPPSYTGRAKDVVIKIAEEGYVAYVLPRGNECSSERGDWASCSLVSLTQKNSVCVCVYVCVCVWVRACCHAHTMTHRFST